MKTMKIMTAMLTPLVIFAVAFALVGCEDEPNAGSLDANVDTSALSDGGDLPGGLHVRPENPEITHVGQKIEFEVFGGHWPYIWSVADTTRGTIAEQQTDGVGERYTAVYTVNEVAANTIIATDGHGRTGTAELSASVDGGPTLAILPATINFGTNVAINTSFDVHAVGGVPPYSWSTDSPTWLNLSATTGSKITVTFAQAVVDSTFKINVYVFDQSESAATCAVTGQ